jgi:hypothetical protein
MQHTTPRKRAKASHERDHDPEKHDNHVTLQNTVYPKKTFGSDFGRGTNDPDNVRRQRQDYFDNWK